LFFQYAIDIKEFLIDNDSASGRVENVVNLTDSSLLELYEVFHNVSTLFLDWNR